MAIDISNFAKAADATSLKPLDRDEAQVGILAPNGLSGGSSVGAVVASVCYYGRVVPSRNMTIVKMAFYVTAADASNPAVDVGIVDQTGARLGAMGAATGRVNAIARVVLTLPTPVILTAGIPYYAAWASGASASPATLVNMVDQAYQLFGAAIPQLRIGYVGNTTVVASSGALTVTAAAPALALLES